jgi:S1-C subfamily serine protease
MVSRILPGSYWPQLGLRHGDLITSVNGVPMTTAADFQRAVARLAPGERLPLVFSRDGAAQTIYVTGNVTGREQRAYRPLDYDDVSPTSRARGWLGVYLDTRYDKYAVVDGIEVGSAADRIGLRAGDWIAAVNGQRVQSPAHLSQIIAELEPGTQIQVQVARREVREVDMTVGQWPATNRYRYESPESSASSENSESSIRQNQDNREQQEQEQQEDGEPTETRQPSARADDAEENP